MTSNTRRLLVSIVLMCAAAMPWHGRVARADESTTVYYISMRGLLSEAVPSFVTVVKPATAQRSTAIAGCDGHTYYATPADAATVSAARAAGNVVQLHRGRAGDPPQSSRIKCIIDASGN